MTKAFSPSRPNLVTIDETAFADNLALVQRLLPPATEIWQVCKGDGYGLGTVRAAELGIKAGLKDFCVGTPEEAVALKAAFPDARVLLFPSALPEDLPELARGGVTPTAHNDASLGAILEKAPGAAFLFKVDTGLSRYGFGEMDWPAAIEAYRSARQGGLQGIYTHFSQAQTAAGNAASLAIFDKRLAVAREALGTSVPAMAAASPALLATPRLPYDRVDPGRALYGMLPPNEAGGHILRPVVRSITSRLLDSRQTSAGGDAAIGYGRAQPGVKRIGTMPLGIFDGLSHQAPFGTVFIRGHEAPVLGRTLLASLIDLTSVPQAEDGDEVVLVGQSGRLNRNLFELAEVLQVSATHLHFSLIRQLPKSTAI